MATTVFFDFEDFELFEWETGCVAGFGAGLFWVVALWVDFLCDLLFDAAGFVFAAGVSWAIRIPAENNATVKVIVLKGKPQHTKIPPRNLVHTFRTEP